MSPSLMSALGGRSVAAEPQPRRRRASRYHKKYRNWFTGQTASGGVVDTSNVDLFKQKAQALGLSVEDYIATLANYAEEYSKEKGLNQTAVVKLRN